VASITGKDVSAFADMVSAKDIVIEPLFGISEERIEARAAMMTAASPEETHMSQFYSVRAPDEKLDELADKFLKNPLVESSYVKPGVELANSQPLWKRMFARRCRMKRTSMSIKALMTCNHRHRRRRSRHRTSRTGSFTSILPR
jgi:hypothetical protein